MTTQYDVATTIQTNPIRYIEEVRRLPFRPRRPALPGCIQVYRGVAGALRCPAGGLTTGELWWYGPRLVYDVDTDNHDFEFRAELGSAGDARRVSVIATGQWRVVAPIQVVEHRVYDVITLIRPRLVDACAEAVDSAPWRSAAQLETILRRRTPEVIGLPEGLRLSRIDIAVQPSGIDAASQGSADE